MENKEKNNKQLLKCTACGEEMPQEQGRLNINQDKFLCFECIKLLK